MHCFNDENVTKTWRLVDPDSKFNSNVLTLTSHRVIFETNRGNLSDLHPSLCSDNWGFLRFFYHNFLLLIRMLFAIVYSLLTIGTEPETSVRFKHILLQDIVEMDFVFVTYNELVNHFMEIYFLCLVSMALLFSPFLAFFFGILAITHVVVTFMKFKLWISTSTKFLMNLISIIVIFVLLVTFIILLVTTLHLLSIFVISLFCAVASFLCATLIRMNNENHQQRAYLSITSRRGKYTMALKPDDVREAKQLIWKTKNDTSKITPVVATNNYERGSSFTQ